MNGGESRTEQIRPTTLESLKSSLRNLRDAILIADAAGTWLWCNKAFTRLTGATVRDLAGADAIRARLGPLFHQAAESLERGRSWKGLARLAEAAPEMQAHLTLFEGETRLTIVTLRPVPRARQRDVTARARARQKRDESLFEYSNDPIFIIRIGGDGDFIVEDVNPAYERVTGLKHADFIGRRLPELLPADQAERVLDRFRQCVETRSPMVYEERLSFAELDVQGSTHLCPVQDASGRIARLIGIRRDVSEHTRLDAELSKREQQLRMIAEAGTDGFWEMRLPQFEVELTGAMASLLGREESEMPRTNIELGALIHPDDRAHSRRAFWAHVDGETAHFRSELRVLHKDGTWRWFGCRGRLLERHPDGTPMRVAGTYRDITERMVSLTAMRESEERYRGVVSVIAEGVIVRAPDASVLACNEAACDILGIPEEELLGTSGIDMELPCIREDGTPFPLEERPSMEALRTGLPVHNVLMGVERGEDDLRWLRTNSVPLIRQGEHVPYAAVTTFSDVTETRATMQALERARIAAEAASKARTEFLAAMSHEIRTPMNGVLGMCEVLLDTKLSPEQRAQADAILESARSLLALINDVLDLSRIEATHFSPERVSFDVAATLEHIVTMLSNEARRKGLTFTLEYPSSMPIWFEGDPGRFRQVVVNLVSNAIRYTDTGSVLLRASWEDPTRTVRIDVVDTGIGITAEQLPALFERFGLVNEASRRRAGGTGLGLSIAKGIAENLDGRIEVESEPGRGSTFSFFLPMFPVERQNPDPAAHEKPAAESGSLEGASILLVEDNLINQRVAMALLQRLGCRVDIAADGADGVAQALAGSYDAILMDCMMPVMDGFDATRAIRAGQIRRRTPIIALTASVMEDERRRCIAAGMDAILGKPVDGKALADTLKIWVRRPRRPA